MVGHWVTQPHNSSVKGRVSLEYNNSVNSWFIASDTGWVRVTKNKRRAVVVGTEIYTTHIETNLSPSTEVSNKLYESIFRAQGYKSIYNKSDKDHSLCY